MAEIRSTLDMVMERAARMAARAEDTSDDQVTEQRGMRLVAEYLKGGHSQLMPLLEKESPADQAAVRRGMAKALLRNIVIPRDEQLMESSLAAISGLLEMTESGGEAETLCLELKQLLEQYSQHREQMKQQLEEAIRNQLAQQMMEQTGENPDPATLDPSRHPQYQKELTQAQVNLNDQYGQAFDQRKEILLQGFGS